MSHPNSNCQPCTNQNPVPCTDCAPVMPVPCLDGEPCDELVDAHCVVYTGPDLTNIICNTGDRLDTILENLALSVGSATVQTQDTEAIALTGDGSGPDKLTATLILSAFPGNIASIRPDGVYVPDNSTPVPPQEPPTCDDIMDLWTVNDGQKNTQDQSGYYFNVTNFVNDASCGLRRVYAPTGFAVSGSARKSAFGTMEWYSSLAAANSAAIAGESVIVFANSTDNLTAKAGVSYFGVGDRIISGTIAITSVATRMANFIFTGTVNAAGTNWNVIFDNCLFQGACAAGGTGFWKGGHFGAFATPFAIQVSAWVDDIYSERPVAVVQSGRLSNFTINYTGNTSIYGLSVNVSGAFNSQITRGTIYAPNLASGGGAGLLMLALGTAKVTMSDITVETTTVRAIYIQCGNATNTPAVICQGLVGKSTDAQGLFVVSSMAPDVISQTNDFIVTHCTGYSVNSSGIHTISGNLKACTGYSVNGYGIYLDGSEFEGYNLNVIECIAESKLNRGMRVDRDCFVVGGTFISRKDDITGNPIYIDNHAWTLDQDHHRHYYIVGVKTIATHKQAFAIAATGSLQDQISCRITGCHFLNEFIDNSVDNVSGIDPLILLPVAVQMDAYGNTN